jgi:hypothetical protein
MKRLYQFGYIYISSASIFVLLTSAREMKVLSTGLTVGDMIGSAPSFTPEGQAAIKRSEHTDSWALAGSFVCTVLGSLSLGFALNHK